MQLVLVEGSRSSCPSGPSAGTWSWSYSTALRPHGLGVPAGFHWGPPGAGWHHGARGRAVGRHGAGGVVRASQRRGVSLGVLIHGAGRGAHAAVSPRAHAHALHLAVARVIRHTLLMHAFHGFVHLVHVLLGVPSRSLGRMGMPGARGPRARSHHTVSRSWGRPRARTRTHHTMSRARGRTRARARARPHHGPRRGAWSWGGSRTWGPSHGGVRGGHLSKFEGL